VRDAVGEGEAAVHRELLRGQLVCDLAVEAEQPLGVVDVDARLAQRLADVERLEPGERVGLGRDAVRDGEQEPPPLPRRERGPAGLGGARRLHGGVDVALAAAWDACEHLARRWVAGLDPIAPGGGDLLAAHHHERGVGNGRGLAHPAPPVGVRITRPPAARFASATASSMRSSGYLEPTSGSRTSEPSPTRSSRRRRLATGSADP
jgi:hypothetical protein